MASPPARLGFVIFGFVSGALRGAIGAGGPPVIVYTSLQPWSKERSKVTLQGYHITSVFLTIVIQAWAGLITSTVVKYFLIFSSCIPPWNLFGLSFLCKHERKEL
jgi:hypothetical protein